MLQVYRIFYLCIVFADEKSISDRICLDKPFGESDSPPEEIRGRFIPAEKEHCKSHVEGHF